MTDSTLKQDFGVAGWFSFGISFRVWVRFGFLTRRRSRSIVAHSEITFSMLLFQLTPGEHAFVSQHGKMSLQNFTEVDFEKSSADDVLATAGSNIKRTLKQ